MFGKIFKSMYAGSMVGAGPVVFALWPYVIANMEPDKNVGFQVQLNPVILATTFGCSVDEVRAAIDYLCAPDEQSRSKAYDGRRLIKVGEFDYTVVNGEHYNKIRTNEELRFKNRTRVARWRAKQTGSLREQQAIREETDAGQGT